ncbi:hypothetical protein OIU76_024162 [Salix suchowensis]|nr:hypothetical protein OIU76_024162 [Salix suchowensis]
MPRIHMSTCRFQISVSPMVFIWFLPIHLNNCRTKIILSYLYIILWLKMSFSVMLYFLIVIPSTLKPHIPFIFNTPRIPPCLAIHLSCVSPCVMVFNAVVSAVHGIP